MAYQELEEDIMCVLKDTAHALGYVIRMNEEWDRAHRLHEVEQEIERRKLARFLDSIADEAPADEE